MSAPAPRRRTSSSEDADRKHIVRVVHSHPAYLRWLRDHTATVLMAEAQRLSEGGHEQAGAILAGRAQRHRSGAEQ